MDFPWHEKQSTLQKLSDNKGSISRNLNYRFRVLMATWRAIKLPCIFQITDPSSPLAVFIFHQYDVPHTDITVHPLCQQHQYKGYKTVSTTSHSSNSYRTHRYKHREFPWKMTGGWAPCRVACQHLHTPADIGTWLCSHGKADAQACFLPSLSSLNSL